MENTKKLLDLIPAGDIAQTVENADPARQKKIQELSEEIANLVGGGTDATTKYHYSPVQV